MDIAATRRPAEGRSSRFQLIGGQAGTVRWRLLGTNNVSLGLAPVDYRGAAECIAAIQWLCANLDHTRMELNHHNGKRWRWVLHAAGGTIATASHTYGRRIEARRGYERFVTALDAAAENLTEDRIVDWRTRRWRPMPTA